MAKARKKRARKPPKLLLFVDTNIWLDVYRGRSEASLTLLRHLESEAVRECLIVTYQLEMEFKKNRQIAILEGMKTLTVAPTPRLGVFSDAAAFRTAERALQIAGERVSKLKRQLSRILETPITHDPVYQACQRLFHRTSPLVLTREDPIRRQIKARALRRFLMGCPPRKRDDTSMGDAINWEWMVECAKRQSAGLVIVSRDADYGVEYEQKVYLNEHLLHEFKDRVSQQRKVILCRKLSEALKHFNVTVTAAEAKEEKEVAEAPAADLISQAERIVRQETLHRERMYQNATEDLARQLAQFERLGNIRNALAVATLAEALTKPGTTDPPTAADSGEKPGGSE
jgi:hypothetical protein